MHAIISFILSLLMGIFPIQISQPCDGIYSTYNSNGLHLMMHDNGTPEVYDDDWVCDWENNRIVGVAVFDE